MINVLIADDHPLVLLGIQFAIQEEEDIQLVAQANNATEILASLQMFSCDVLVTDFHMPDCNHGDGLRMLETIHRKYPQLRIVVVSMLDNLGVISAIKRIGVYGIVSKNDVSQRIVHAIRRVHGGHFYDSDSIQQLTQRLSFFKSGALSLKELEVVRLIAGGMTVTDIAQMRHRSTKTISTQKVTAMRKLGLLNDSQLVQYAMTQGLLK
jgi:two-component system capsular synthesis response regulator RcsB